MSDEILFVVITLLDLCVMIACWKAGRRWLEIFVILNYIFANLFIQKFTDILGYHVTIASVFYAAIYLGTDIITEHFGKKAGFQMVWRCFFAILALTIAEQAVLLLSHTPETEAVSMAMDTLFSAVPRITFASLLAFLIIQRFDIWFYHWIHQKTKGKHLWLRNIASTTASQALDTVLFFGVAFYGVLENEVLFSIAVLGFIMKFIVALLDTPFIYLSYWIKGKSLKEASHIPNG